MLQLPAHTTGVAMVRFAEPKAPTHVARYQVKRRYRGGHDWDVIGSLLVNVGSDQDMAMLTRLDRRLHYKLDGVEVDRVMLKLDAPEKSRSLDDLQRFRRKMGMVLRAYEQEQTEIRAQKHGLFVEDELARLDRDLEEAWAKAERIYGHSKEDYYSPTT